MDQQRVAHRHPHRRGWALVLPFCLACASILSFAGPGTAPAKDCSLATDGPTATAGREPSPLPFPPIQLEISVPFEPTLYPSGDFNYLVYEIRLQNHADSPLKVQGIEITASGSARRSVIADISGPPLHEWLKPIGREQIDGDHPLGSGSGAIALVCLAFDRASSAPEILRHRVFVNGTVAEGPSIGIRHSRLRVLGPPVAGAGWLADNAPSLSSHHRTGIFIVDGRARIARRFAIDWKRVKHGETYSGDARDVRSYFSYGERVFSVADATVVHVTNGLPDNVPRTPAGFIPALPITLENVAGNAVVLDLGDGQFAYYAHLKPGSVRVNVGQRVKRGEWLGQIGNSGDSRWPHLHFQVTEGQGILASEGVPFVIDQFRTRGDGGSPQARSNEYPMGNITVEFAADLDPPKQ